MHSQAFLTVVPAGKASGFCRLTRSDMLRIVMEAPSHAMSQKLPG
jgi:hypothetical protein